MYDKDTHFDFYSNTPVFGSPPSWLTARLGRGVVKKTVNQKLGIYDRSESDVYDHRLIHNEFQASENAKSENCVSVPVHKKDLTSANHFSLTPDYFKEVQEKRRLFVDAITRLYGASEKDFPNIGKHVKRINCCSFYVVLRRFFSTGEAHKIGQSMCKSKLCPVCSSLLAAKRQKLVSDYFIANKEAYQGKHFNHMVLTLKHDSETRNGFYAAELLNHFLSLRDNRFSRDFWKDLVYGGLYSLEVKQGSTTPHIHLHCLLITNRKVSHQDAEFIKTSWFRYTGDSDQIFCEPIYYFLGDRKDWTNRVRVDFDPEKHDFNMLSRALSECIKYVAKFDFSQEHKLEDAVLNEFLTTRIRTFSRFGCLYSVKSLNIDYKDLQDVSTSDKGLISLLTGELVEVSETELLLTNVHNAERVFVENGQYFDVLEEKKARVYNYQALNELRKDMQKSYHAYLSDCWLKGNKIMLSPTDNLTYQKGGSE